MPLEEPESFNLEQALLEEKSPESSSTPAKPDESKAALRDTLFRGDAENKSADDVLPEDSDDDDGTDDASAQSDDDGVTDDDATQDEDVDVFERAAAVGLDLKSKYKTKKDAVEGLLHAARLVGQRDQYAEYGRQLLENPDAVLEALQKARGKKEEAAPPPKVEKKSDVPEYDPGWLKLLDEEGKALPGVDPAIPHKIAKYHEFVRERATKIALDPEAVLGPIFEERLKKLADERAKEIVKQSEDRLRQEQEHARVSHEIESLVKEEASWAFVDGDIRKPPTPEGMVLGKWLKVFETPDQYGNIPIPDNRIRKEVAVMFARRELGGIKEKENPEVRRQKQGKVTKKPNRSATDPTEKHWPKGLSLEDALARAIEKDS